MGFSWKIHPDVCPFSYLNFLPFYFNNNNNNVQSIRVLLNEPVISMQDEEVDVDMYDG